MEQQACNALDERVPGIAAELAVAGAVISQQGTQDDTDNDSEYQADACHPVKQRTELRSIVSSFYFLDIVAMIVQGCHMAWARFQGACLSESEY